MDERCQCFPSSNISKPWEATPTNKSFVLGSKGRATMYRSKDKIYTQIPLLLTRENVITTPLNPINIKKTSKKKKKRQKLKVLEYFGEKSGARQKKGSLIIAIN